MKQNSVTQKRARKTTKSVKTAEGVTVQKPVKKRRPQPVAASAPLPPEVKAQPEWVELFPQGISVSTEMGRPVLILKDKNGINVLPVWIQPLDAGVALAELSQGTGATPHAVTRQLLAELGLRIESCSFTDLIGHHQYAQLTFRYEKGSDSQPEGESKAHTLRVRADEAMSFCLQGRARFFSTQPFMARCRALDEDLSKLEQNMVHGLLPGLQEGAEMSSKKHPYVM